MHMCRHPFKGKGIKKESNEKGKPPKHQRAYERASEVVATGKGACGRKLPKHSFWFLVQEAVEGHW